MLCHPRGIDLGPGVKLVVPFLIFSDPNGLVAYHLNARHNGYHRLRVIATDKFGPPMKRDTKTYTTSFGQVVEGEVLKWTWPSGTTAWLSERCGKVDESCLGVVTRQYREAERSRDQGIVERAKKQF
jgi:hypothetical protein